MIESLSVRGFQKHQSRKITFDPFVTTLVGETEAGKSSLIRALRWVALNEFQGPTNELINWDADFAKVLLRFDGGRKLSRRRTRKGSGNYYTLDGKTFRAFKLDVPTDIAKALNVGLENFQAQDDPRFWLDFPGGQVSKDLNRIINLDAIDTTLHNLSSRLSRCRAESRVCLDRLSDSLKQRNTLAWVEDANRTLSDLEKGQKALDHQTSELDALQVLVKEATRARKTLSSASKAKAEGRRALKLGRIARRSAKRADRLASLVEKISQNETAVKVTIPDLSDLDSTFETMGKNVERCERLSKLIADIEHERESECQSRAAAKTIRKKLGKRCPACGQTIRTQEQS